LKGLLGRQITEGIAPGEEKGRIKIAWTQYSPFYPARQSYETVNNGPLGASLGTEVFGFAAGIG